MAVESELEGLVELRVGGMTCGACSARVQRKLNKLDGVSAEVNAATELALIHLTRPVPTDVLVTAVVDAGYSATVRSSTTFGTGDEAASAGGSRVLGARLLVAGLLMMPITDLTIGSVISATVRFPGWQWVLLAMVAPVVIWCAWPIHAAAVRALRHRTATMDTLVSLGIVAAVAWSLYTLLAHPHAFTDDEVSAWQRLWRPSGSMYFEVAAGVTTFVLAGRFFEARARQRAGRALDGLRALAPRTACRLDDNGDTSDVPVDELQPGDRILVRNGETVPADGDAESGPAAVDASSMTGEPVPIAVDSGQRVLAGTTVVDGRLILRVTDTGTGTQLGQLTRLVERAQFGKARLQTLADRISGVFVPVVIGLAVATSAGWLAFGASTDRAVGVGLAVLIVACPCALGLATPMALLVASGRAAQLGIFVRSQQALETARAITTVVLDKTGTLTTGRLGVAHFEVTGTADRDEIARAASAAEEGSPHPAAAAIRDYTRRTHGPPLDEPAGQFGNIPGRGVSAEVDGQVIVVGSAGLLAERGVPIGDDLATVARDWAGRGCSIAYVARNQTAVALFALTDSVRTSAKPAVDALRAAGVRTVLLTGDNAETAAAVGGFLDVDEIVADVLPTGKAAAVRRLGEGGAVAMVGDGINDAPALAGADLGMAVVTGSDIALGAADIVLVGEDLTTVAAAIRLSRATSRTIRANLAWAFGYNLAAIPLAAAGLLSPLITGAAMALSSLIVVTNSLRLGSFDRTTRRALWGDTAEGIAPGTARTGVHTLTPTEKAIN